MIVPILLLLACSGGADDTGTADSGSGGVDPAWASCNTLLSPGSADDRAAVQTAFIEANDGDELCLDAGTWSFDSELSLSVGNVTLRGAGIGATVLDFSTQDVGANGIAITGDGVTVRDLTVKNTPGDGIRASSVDGITFQRVQVGWDAEASLDNGAYGLYPVESTRVRIEECEVYGARDAGIYVGQSTDILVKDSVAWGNVAGIEIENSTDAEVVGNTATDNTAGILVFNLPGLPLQDGKRAKVHGNIISDNNRDNFAQEGTIVASVPKGLGVMILASDANEVTDNTITGNGSTGVLIVSYIEALMGAYDDDAFNAYPQDNWVHDNVYENNGTDTDSLLDAVIPEPRPLPAILWDGCQEPVEGGTLPANNCVDGDKTAGWMNFGWCGGGEVNPAAMVCEGTALGGQDP